MVELVPNRFFWISQDTIWSSFIDKDTEKEPETYLIAIEEDDQKNINVQYWNITQKLDLEQLVKEACNKLDIRSLTENEKQKLEKLKLSSE